MASFVDQIEALTGMSLTTFVTVAVVVFSVVYILYSSFVPYRNLGPVYEPPKPISIGEITADELAVYDGRDPDKPLLLAIRGNIYDVSRGKAFYGPGGPYNCFTGKDASRAFALTSTDPKDCIADLDGLSPGELETLKDWEGSLQFKYDIVGRLTGSSKSGSGKDKDTGKEEAESKATDSATSAEATS